MTSQSLTADQTSAANALWDLLPHGTYTWVIKGNRKAYIGGIVTKTPAPQSPNQLLSGFDSIYNDPNLKEVTPLNSAKKGIDLMIRVLTGEFSGTGLDNFKSGPVYELLETTKKILEDKLAGRSRSGVETPNKSTTPNKTPATSPARSAKSFDPSNPHNKQSQTKLDFGATEKVKTPMDLLLEQINAVEEAKEVPDVVTEIVDRKQEDPSPYFGPDDEATNATLRKFLGHATPAYLDDLTTRIMLISEQTKLIAPIPEQIDNSVSTQMEAINEVKDRLRNLEKAMDTVLTSNTLILQAVTGKKPAPPKNPAPRPADREDEDDDHSFGFKKTFKEKDLASNATNHLAQLGNLLAQMNKGTK